MPMPHPILTCVAAVCVSTAVLAGPATQPARRSHGPAPTTPVVPLSRPAIVDPRQPAFVPKFAQVNNPPVGQFDERSYANRFTTPSPVFIGGYYGFGFGGYGWGYGGRHAVWGGDWR